MIKNFWQKLPNMKKNGRPFFAIAPMADVTDVAFRSMFVKYGKPDVMWTEFISADGLASKEGRKAFKHDLLFTKKERPIVVQLFSSNPLKMRIASSYVASLGFDGIDINMGCPDKKVEKQGAGAAMMKDMKRAGEVIQAVKDGIKDAKKDIPVSVKTRIGYNTNQINEWIPFLLSQDISALTIHARTRKEMSKVPARWEHIKEVVEIRNRMGVSTKIIGNGDVVDIEDGIMKCKETGCDGVMVGRGIFGNPWFFGSLHKINSKFSRVLGRGRTRGQTSSKILINFMMTIQERLKILVEHTKLFENKLGKVKSFNIMKKHYKAYVNGWDGAKDLRIKLMNAKNSKEVEQIVKEYLKRQTKNKMI